MSEISFSSVIPPDHRSAVVPDVHISMGQSWRANDFESFGEFGFAEHAALSLQVSSIGGIHAGEPGPLAVSAGVQLTGNIIGVTNYSSDDTFAIGRCAIVAQQLLRKYAGVTPLPPIIEACFSYPGSTWTYGGGGGLAPGSSFTASVTSDLMTVTGSPVGVIAAGQQVVAAGLNSATHIISLGTGTGGAGTYHTAIGQVFVTSTFVMTHATVVARTLVALADTFIVLEVISGTVTVGDAIPAPALAGTTIIADLGGGGGVGDYQMRVGAAQTVGSEAMISKGVSWTNMVTALGQYNALSASALYLPGEFSSFGYTQGGAIDLTIESKVADLVDMFTDLDALDLPGAGTTGLIGYFGLPAAISTGTTYPETNFGTYEFCRTNAPDAGGTWSGRCFATSPSFPWPFANLTLPPQYDPAVFDAPVDNIHTGNYGTARWGEIEGYVRRLVQDLDIMWTPLWRPLTGGAIVVSGQTVTIPFARPTSPDFETTPMVFQSDELDGIKVWPDHGFAVSRGGPFFTISSVVISGLSVVLTLVQTVNPGDDLEVSYAWYGPGGSNPGSFSGIGGNLVMNGPPSVLFPGNTIDAWAWPFIETVTAP